MGEKLEPMETGEFQAVILSELRGLREDVQETQDAVEETQNSVRDLDKSTAIMKVEIETRLDTLNQRGAEDREKRDTQVNTLHKKLDAVAENTTATASAFQAHNEDANRHSGETPGKGEAVKTGAKIAGGVGLGGGLIWGIVEVVKLITTT